MASVDVMYEDGECCDSDPQTPLSPKHKTEQQDEESGSPDSKPSIENLDVLGAVNEEDEESLQAMIDDQAREDANDWTLQLSTQAGLNAREPTSTDPESGLEDC